MPTYRTFTRSCTNWSEVAAVALGETPEPRHEQLSLL